MDKCVNISHKDFQELVRQSNINPLILKSKVGVWQEANNSDEFPTLEQLGINSNNINYNLKAINILLSDKGEQIFDKGKKANWDLNKILTELQIPKEQKQLILDLGITENKANVIIPIGTSGSGKSTFIKSLPQENLVVIEPDAMRVEFTGDMNDKSKDKEIYIEAANRAIQAIKQGKQVVFDTTNLTKDKRTPFIEAIKKALPNANIQYKLMELNPELAKQRIKTDIAAGKNRANVPDSTIDRHAESYKQMLEDIKSEPISEFKSTDLREQLALELASNYSYTVEVNTTIATHSIAPEESDFYTDNRIISQEKGQPTQYYSNLTSPGGTNYRELEISTPAITPSIKGHAQFATDKGIGWARVDDKKNKVFGWKEENDFLNSETAQYNPISKDDKIVFGHPGIGKTFLKESGRTDVIDFDSDYKNKINEKFNLPKGFKARNDFQKSNKEEYQKAVRELWVEAKQEAKKTGKQLFASDMILLREFANDFDKVITMSKDTFVNRAKQRNDYTEGETEKWKNSLDTEISKIDKSKVINTDKYLSDLLEGNPKTLRILEMQSDLFQKGRDKDDLINNVSPTNLDSAEYSIFGVEEYSFEYNGDKYESKVVNIYYPEENQTEPTEVLTKNGEKIDYIEMNNAKGAYTLSIKDSSKNKFLQLLNKDSNWVTFFIKSIIQNATKEGYEKVLFPKGETAARVEGHTTLENELTSINKDIEALQKDIEKTKADTRFTENELQNIRNRKQKSIDELEKRKSELKSQGIEKLKPIEAFYEIKVGNILEKQFGKDNVKTITDEYGNQWREIDLSNEKIITETKSIGIGRIYIPDTEIKNKYFKDSNATTVKQALTDISTSNHQLNKLAEKLLDYTEVNNVDIELIDAKVFGRNSESDVLGIAHYIPNERKIQIAQHANYINGKSEAVILHEILHAFSYDIIHTEGKTSSDFKMLFQYATQFFSRYEPETGEGEYATYTADEFFVALFTDSMFIKALSKIPAFYYEDFDGKLYKAVKYHNFLEQIFDFLLKQLKISRTDSLYKQAFEVATNILEDAKYHADSNYNYSLEDIPFSKVSSNVPINIGRVSTKEKPIIIPLTDNTRTAYKEANLLDEKGEVKLLEEKEAFAWVNRHDTYENAMYSIAARYQGKYPKKKGKGTVDMYRMFMAEKFVPEAPKNNVVGRVATKFQSAVKEPTNNEENVLSYLAFKKDLKIAVQKKFEEYKITHSNIKNTKEYKDKVIKFNTILSNLKNEIEKVDVKDADIVFKVFIDEINDLNEIIDKLSPEDYANYEVDDRIEKLVNMFLDESLKHEGNTNSIAIDGSSFHNYGNMINKVIALRTKYKASYSRITLNLLKQNPLYFAKTYNMSPEELKIFEAEVRSLTENVDDINELQKNFLGSNSNDDSIGILVADVSLKYNLQKVQEMIFKYCEELKELDSKLSSEFKDGKVSFDTFFEKDQHGVETGKIVHLYSSEYFDELEKFNKLNEEFNYARKEDKIKFYRGKVNWLRANTEVIDFRKLQYFKDKFGSRYDKHFVFSSSEMSAYEEILRRNLGKYYDIMIEELEENLNDFETFRESKEMEDNEYKYKHIKEESPWEFLDNYYNTFDPNQSLRPVPYDHNGNPQQALLRGNYNTFVPRKSIKEGRYYNNDFDKVQESDNMFQYWNILRQLHSKHIDPIFTSKGYNLHNITYAKFLKESAELLADTKNIKWMKKVWNGLLTKYKDIWTDTRSVKDSSNQEEVIKNYSDKTKETIKRFESLLKLKDVNQLIQMIDERGITLDRSKKLNRKDLAEIIARHDVLSMYSKDLTKITLALTELATTHRARVETANSIEVVKRYNSTILDKNKRTRKNSQDKLESWVDTVIYNRRNSESMDSTVKNLGKVFNETDKKLTDVVKEIRKSNGDMAFTFQGISYYKVDNNYKSITIATSEEHLLDKEKFELALEEYISDILKQRGTPITLHSILTGILKVKIMTGLGWNLKSGIRNRVEGTITNIIRDSQGDTWKPGTINYAKAFMAGINMVRLSEGRLSAHGKKRMDQQKTFIELFQNLGVYEDRKNELDRKNTVSKFGKLTRNINMYTASVDLPEFKNQGEIVFCMLANLKVTAENGQEFDFFDKETMEFTLFEPGTTIVKEGFRTAENLGWETFQLNNETTNQFFIHKTRIDEVIKHTQGNYSNLDSIKFQEKLFGRAMMLFMRWFPEHLNQRFGSRRFNLVQENSKYMGRYKAMYNNPALLGIGTTATLLATFGPATAAILGAGGFLVLPFILKKVFNSVLKTDKQIILHSYTLKSTISMLQEVLIQSLNLPMKMARIKKGHISAFKEFSLDNLSNDTSDFSKEEVRAMKGMCMEIAVMLDGILLYVAMKALGQALGAGDDDDDDDEKKKHSKDWDKLATTYFFNYVSNTGKQLISSFLSYANPLTIFEQNSKIALVRMGDETIKLISYIIKYAKGEERGGTKMADKILTFQPFLPLPSSFKDILVKDAEEVGQGQYPFFDKRIYREDIWMEQMFQSEEKKAQKEVNARRQTLNEELDLRFRQQLREYNPELTEYEVQEEAKKLAKEALNETYKNGNKKSRTRSSRTRTKSKRKKESESYEETLERFEELKPEIEEKYGLD